ncbi:uncharacterized protein METZ01_LOCUS493035 [marine metagenome]|uniref:Uncharacterized protein n=1 Tax=marine metagenome TaxID=408172 RepID=A0A383D716_9ZZZZ
MVKQWIGNFTPKQIVISLGLFLIILVAVAWYINNSLVSDESTTNSKTHHYKQGGSETDGSGARTGNKYFDPTKKTPTAVPAP